jgi:hypothetical protein
VRGLLQEYCLGPRLPCLVRLVGGIDVVPVADVLDDLPLPEVRGAGVRASVPVRCGGGLAGAVGHVGVGIDGHCSPPAAVDT